MISSMPPLVLFVTVIFLLSLLGTAMMRWLAGRLGWVAKPRADRWHKKPTALHGGVGFYPAFLLGSCVILFWQLSGGLHDWSSLSTVSNDVVLAAALLIGSLLMFCLGLWDDFVNLRPATKFIGQLVAASVFIFAGGAFPLSDNYVLDILVTYFWFVGIANAVNMLDNMDGLASGVVILAGATVVVLSLQANPSLEHTPLAALLGVMLVSALLGFWIHNRPPATIFMGDSGSLFIGYVLAALAVPSPLNDFLGVQSRANVLGPVLALLIPATVLAVPIFDTTLVTITRKWRAAKASQGGRDHSSHRLVGLGLSENKAVWVLYSFSVLGGIVAILMQHFPAQSLPLLGFFVLVLILSGIYLGHVKVQIAEPNRLPPAWTPLVSELLYKRRAAEVLLDTILIVLCFYGAYLLRFEGFIDEETRKAIFVALPIVVASCLVAFFLAGIYRGQWKLISVSDLPSYCLGVVGGALFSLAVVTLVTRFDVGHSRSAYIIFALLVFIALLGSRLSFRLLDALLRNGSQRGNGDRTPVLIYGAGKAGKLLHEEIVSNPLMSGYAAVGFVDDDPHRVGRNLCGISVKNRAEWLKQQWEGPVEIWVSSKFIPDCLIHDFASQWRDMPTVRRLQLQMTTVGDSLKEAQDILAPDCPISANN